MTVGILGGALGILTGPRPPPATTGGHSTLQPSAVLRVRRPACLRARCKVVAAIPASAASASS